VRGTLVSAPPDDPTALTGCRGVATTIDFYYDTATSQTYHECYGDPQESDTTPTVSGELPERVAQGALHVPSAGDTPVHDYAVQITGGEYEGAYRINIGTEATPEYVYCTSRGIITQGGTACRINPCDETVGDFIAFNAADADGDACYHTCYK